MDYVFNFASPASPPEYLRLGIETLRWVPSASRTRWRLQHSTARVLFTRPPQSATATRCSIRKPESYWGNVNPVGPRSVYDEAKRFGEAMVMAYNRSRGVDTHLVRIFNTYGPRLHPDDGRVVSNFMMQALRGEPLTIYGDGSQTRSFCYVDDLIEGIVLLSRTDEHLPVNIGNPERVHHSGMRKDGAGGDGVRERDALRRICLRTIPCGASPTSPRRALCSDGSRASVSSKD